MKQTINYQLINPSGNITAIVFGKYTKDQKQIINSSIFINNNKIEQIGYIYSENSQKYFEMMGNEFSANGCRAAGFCFLKGQKDFVSFYSSGLKRPVTVNIKQNLATLIFNSKVSSKFFKIRSNVIKIKLFNTNFYLINSLPNNNFFESLIDKNKNSTGIIFYQNNKITPYFYVKSINKIIPENSCGSGSLALSLLTNQDKIIQPSGEILSITNNPLSLSGKISYLGTYNVKINL